MASNLRKKAISGVIWSGFQKYSNIFIQFISGIILARLLTPYDYGCIGMLLIFMVLAEAFIDGGFGSALIQKKTPTQDDYSTIFFWNLGVAALMYIILFFSAPLIARYYNIPLLCSVLRVQGLVLFIYAFNIVQQNQLKKQLRFKIISIVSITTSIIALCVTVYLAYNGFGVWSLVAQNLILASIPAFVFWFFIKWRPSWTFSLASFKELFSFGFYMFLTDLVNKFCQQIQVLLIGKLFSPSTLGFFSRAMGTERVASSSISSAISQVSYPLYSQVQDDRVAVANMIKRMGMVISFITFPLMAILILVAKPLFLGLYTEKWINSVPYFQILCIVGLASCLQAINTQPIAAIGKSKTMFKWTLIKRTVGLVFMVGGLLLYGMKGFMVGIVVYNWFCYLVNIALVSYYIGYKWYYQLKDLLPVTLITLLATVVGFLGSSFFRLDIYTTGVLRALLFLFVYVSWFLIFKPESYKYTLSLIPKRFRFFDK